MAHCQQQRWNDVFLLLNHLSLLVISGLFCGVASLLCHNHLDGGRIDLFLALAMTTATEYICVFVYFITTLVTLQESHLRVLMCVGLLLSSEIMVYLMPRWILSNPLFHASTPRHIASSVAYDVMAAEVFVTIIVVVLLVDLVKSVISQRASAAQVSLEAFDSEKQLLRSAENGTMV